MCKSSPGCFTPLSNYTRVLLFSEASRSVVVSCGVGTQGIQSGLSVRVNYVGWSDTLWLEIFVVLQCVVLCWVVAVRWSVVFLEAGVFLSLGKLALDHAIEVLLGKDTVLRNPVVHSCWLVVVQMLEVRSVWVAKKEWHESISVVDSVNFLTLQEAKNVVLNDWVLCHGGWVSSGCIEANCITKSKDVVVGLVLQCVLVHINTTWLVSKTSVN